MNVNTILLWIVGLSAGSGVLLNLVRYRLRYPGWLAVNGLILVVMLAGWRIQPDLAGWIALWVWLPFMLIPAWGSQTLNRLLIRERYGLARILSRTLACLHPFDGWLRLPRRVEILSDLQAGDWDSAEERAGPIVARDPSLARFMILQRFRHRGEWAELREWVEENVPPAEHRADAPCVSLYIRSLGEEGDLTTLLKQYNEAGTSLPGADARILVQLFVAAYTGHEELVRRISSGPLRALPHRTRLFWQATVQQTAGNFEAATATLTELERGGEPAKRLSRQRRANPLTAVRSDELPADTRALLADFVKETEVALRGTARRSRPPLLTLGFMAFNALVHIGSTWGESSNGFDTIERRGLVIPPELVQDTWKRVFTAGFLHHGALHLALNLAALWILGRYVEQRWGRRALFSVYLAATFGGNALALVLIPSPTIRPLLLVGASGGIMGILGLALALIAREWRQERGETQRRQLHLLIVVFLVQVLFDFFTPEVSSTVHLAGFGIGFSGGVMWCLWRPQLHPPAATE